MGLQRHSNTFVEDDKSGQQDALTCFLPDPYDCGVPEVYPSLTIHRAFRAQGNSKVLAPFSPAKMQTFLILYKLQAPEVPTDRYTEGDVIKT